MPNDHEEIANIVVEKLRNERSANRDDEFVKKLVTAMVEHRSPCHNLSDEEVQTLRAFVASRVRFAKSKGLVKAGLVLYVLKEVITFVVSNVHMGAKP